MINPDAPKQNVDAAIYEARASQARYPVAAIVIMILAPIAMVHFIMVTQSLNADIAAAQQSEATYSSDCNSAVVAGGVRDSLAVFNAGNDAISDYATKHAGDACRFDPELGEFLQQVDKTGSFYYARVTPSAGSDYNVKLATSASPSPIGQMTTIVLERWNGISNDLSPSESTGGSGGSSSVGGSLADGIISSIVNAPQENGDNVAAVDINGADYQSSLNPYAQELVLDAKHSGSEKAIWLCVAAFAAGAAWLIFGLLGLTAPRPPQ